MTDLDLNKLRELAQEATQGVWIVNFVSGAGIEMRVPYRDSTRLTFVEVWRQFPEREWDKELWANAVYINYAMPKNILKLLDYVKTLEGDLEKCYDELHYTESTLEAASCDLQPSEEFESGFDCMGDFAMHVWQGFKKEIDELKNRETVAWQVREFFMDEEVWSNWRSIDEVDLDIWKSRVRRFPTLYQMRELVVK